MGLSRGFTSEIKFVVGAAVGARIGDWARARLAPDPHGGGAHGDEYRVTSLYLDTAARDVFHRRGSYGRSKYRVRRYHQEPSVYLERKLRTGSRLAKWRTSIEMTALPSLDLDQPLNGDGTAWFRRRVAVRRLRPVCQVSYVRLARTSDTPDGPARLTLDHSLAAIPVSAFAFESRPGTPLLGDEMILELKFRGTMPGIFKELVETVALEPGRSSKYRVAAAALGLVVAPASGSSHALHA